MKGGSKVVVEPHRHDGVFIAKGKEDALCTKNLVPGVAVYNEKRVSVQVPTSSYFLDCPFPIMLCFRYFLACF